MFLTYEGTDPSKHNNTWSKTCAVSGAGKRNMVKCHFLLRTQESTAVAKLGRTLVTPRITARLVFDSVRSLGGAKLMSKDRGLLIRIAEM